MKNERNLFKEIAGRSIGWAIVMVVMGLLAVISPHASGLAVSVLIAWLLVLSGLTHLASAYVGRHAGAFLWRLLTGVVYVLGGGLLMFCPALALQYTAVSLAVIFAMEGVFEIATFLLLRADSGCGWVLVNALFTVFLAFLLMLLRSFNPIGAAAIILGINLILHGFTALMYLLTARREMESLSA